MRFCKLLLRVINYTRRKPYQACIEQTLLIPKQRKQPLQRLQRISIYRVLSPFASRYSSDDTFLDSLNPSTKKAPQRRGGNPRFVFNK